MGEWGENELTVWHMIFPWAGGAANLHFCHVHSHLMTNLTCVPVIISSLFTTQFYEIFTWKGGSGRVVVWLQWNKSLLQSVHFVITQNCFTEFLIADPEWVRFEVQFAGMFNQLRVMVVISMTLSVGILNWHIMFRFQKLSL